MIRPKFALTLILLCAVLGCRKENAANIGAGDKLPGFETVTYKSTDKGWALIVFFNTDCEDCRNELPVIQRVYDELTNVVVVGIARDQSDSSVEKYFRENKLSFPFIPDKERMLYSLFASHTIPRCYLAKDGIVQAAWDDNPIMTFEEVYEMAGEINLFESNLRQVLANRLVKQYRDEARTATEMEQEASDKYRNLCQRIYNKLPAEGRKQIKEELKEAFYSDLKKEDNRLRNKITSLEEKLKSI